MSLSGSHGLKMNSVLVIGGAGLIGAPFCHHLAKAGYVPIAYDSPKAGYETRVKWGPLVRGNPHERDHLRSVIDQYKPDTIIYCPPHSNPGLIMSDPATAYRTQLSGMLTVLELAREKSIEQFIYISNASIYGDAGAQPIREEHAAAPLGPFGSSMMIAERMIRDYADVHTFRYTILRSFSVAGADQEAHLSEDIDNSFRLLPNLIAVATGLRPQVKIHGSNYTTPDGTAIRDYVHVTDLADAMLLAIRAIEFGSESRIYNIGSGNGTSVLELVKLAERASHRRIPIAYGPRRADDAPCLISDSSLARVKLGWTAKQSAPDQIIRSAWSEWLDQTGSHQQDQRSRIAG
jgi:UDP-glucose-4-epimerase GalE